MKIADIVEILEAEVLVGENMLDHVIETACGADLMSDVLAFAKERAALLTGLLNPQVIRTADMMDSRCIVFVRGKEPDAAMIELAKDREIAILTTKYCMFSSCGKLYGAGLIPTKEKKE